jgi:hypothetical protein
MPPFLGLQTFTSARGEGLRPELRALFERLATASNCDVTVRADGMVQSGPDPVCAKAPLQTPLRNSDANPSTALPAGAASNPNHQAEIRKVS